MMSDFVTPLLEWLNANPEWAGFVTFLISTAESVAIIGTIIPGSITMTAIGALAGSGIIPLWSTIFWAMAGAVMGDGISYWMGYYFKDRLRIIWPFKHNPIILAKGENFVHRYGIMSVFMGRFVGPVRALVPLIAGMLGMRPIQFTIANITSAIGWAPIYMLPGIIIGAASKELPPDIALHVILVLFLMLMFISLFLWVIYKILMLINYQTEQNLVRLWNNLKKSRYFHSFTILLKHHDPKEHHGQLILAFYFLITSISFLLLTAYIKIHGAASLEINNIIYHFFRGLRAQQFDHIMIYLTLFGQKQIIFSLFACLFTWLIFIKRFRAACHWLALGFITSGSIYFIKKIIASPRPFGLLHPITSFSMPSGHATLSFAIFFGLTYFISFNLSKSLRKISYTICSILVISIAASRLYLGAHWFTDIIAGWLLASSILILIILSFNREHEAKLPIPSLIIISVLALSISSYTFNHYYHTQLKNTYTEKDWPIQTVSSKDWWEQKYQLDNMQVSLFGIPSQLLNIQWAGTIDEIYQALRNMGWQEPPARDLISTLHRISDINSTEYLPMVSPQYLDHKPKIVLAKRVNHGKQLLVLRLWSAYYIFKSNQLPLFVGTVGIVPRSYGWLFRKKNKLDINPIEIVNLQQLPQNMQWKIVDHPILHKNKIQTHKILFIKPNKLDAH